MLRARVVAAEPPRPFWPGQSLLMPGPARSRARAGRRFPLAGVPGGGQPVASGDSAVLAEFAAMRVEQQKFRQDLARVNTEFVEANDAATAEQAQRAAAAVDPQAVERLAGLAVVVALVLPAGSL
eukprot:8593640-Lingulodinium_polyedra.AAC.1